MHHDKSKQKQQQKYETKKNRKKCGNVKIG